MLDMTSLSEIRMGKAQTMIILGVLLLCGFLTLCIREAPIQQHAQSRSDQISPDTAMVTRDLPELVLPSNTTSPSLDGSSQWRILCFEAAQGRQATSVDGCRPTFNLVRGLPNFRLIQEFQEGKYPKKPYRPPYIFYHNESTCAIQVASGSKTLNDKFSFEQIKTRATDIVEDCQAQGGYGGVAPLGEDIGWTVKVIGLAVAEASQKG